MLQILTQIARFDFKSTAKNTLICASLLFVTACATAPNQQGSGSHNITPIHSNDIWQRIRDNYAMPNLYNDEVLAKENYYATRADYVGRMTERSGDFLYLIMNEIERRHMPSELALLPFVESAFVTSAKSSAKASGLWQFMPATGRDYSLKQNRFTDQRNDVVASTDAALTYLQKLHDQFGDWHLALAAYNWGEGNVAKAVNRSYAAGGSGGYQDIKMPTETRQYVPKLQAIKNIVSNPTLFGITLPNVHNRARHEAVIVTRDIDISTAAQLAGMSEEEFKRINPAHKKPVIVAALGSKILVPTERAEDVRDALSNHSRQLATLTTYTTFSSESLADIAAKYNTDEYRLRELNSIPENHNYIQANSTLIVPRINKNDEIPYLALNSSVRSSSGGAGFDNIPNQDPSIYLSDPTPANPLIVQANDSTFQIPNTPKIVANQESSTGLVAHQDDADNLSKLINNPPPIYDTPTRVPVVTNNPTDTLLTAKDLPSSIVALDEAHVQVLPVEPDNTSSTTNTTPQAMTLKDLQLSPVSVVPAFTSNPVLTTNTAIDATTASMTPLPLVTPANPVIIQAEPTSPSPVEPALLASNNTAVAKETPKAHTSATTVEVATTNPPISDSGKRMAYNKTNSSKNVVKTSNRIKTTNVVTPTKKATEVVKIKPTTKLHKAEKDNDKVVTKPLNKTPAKKEAGKTLAKSTANTKADKPTSAVSKNTKGKTPPTASLSQAKTPSAKTNPKSGVKTVTELSKKDSKTKIAEKAVVKPAAKSVVKTPTQLVKKDSKTKEAVNTKAKKK